MKPNTKCVDPSKGWQGALIAPCLGCRAVFSPRISRVSNRGLESTLFAILEMPANICERDISLNSEGTRFKSSEALQHRTAQTGFNFGCESLILIYMSISHVNILIQ